MNPATGVELRMLGPLEVLRDGSPLAVGGPKPRAVLWMLMLRANRTVPRDALVHGLWGDRPPPSATNTLQTYLTHLRNTLEPGRSRDEPSRVLATIGDGYVLRIDPDRIDTLRFERLTAEARQAIGENDHRRAMDLLDRALELWQADVIVAPAIHGIEADVARLEELRLAAVEDRFEVGLALGRHCHLVGEMHHVLASHPLRERIWAQLMVGLYRGGRQGEALRCYQRARHMLAEELGIEPSHALRDLEGAILRHDPSLDLPAPPAGAPRARAWPAGAPATAPPGADPAFAPGEPRPTVFVGREPELIKLCVAWEDARSGRGRVTFVTGEAGIGKTSLVRRFEAVAAGRGASVLWGRSWQGEGVPALWPWTQVVRSWAAAHPPEEVRAAMGRGGGYIACYVPGLADVLGGVAPVETHDPEHGRFALFDALAGFFRRAARRTPLVVVLEDIHASHPLSLRFLEFLGQGLDDLPLLVVATFREGGRAPDDDLAQTVVQLSRGLGCRRIALSGFSVDELGRYVSGAASVPVAAEKVAELHRLTSGNPFFVAELVRLLVAEGGLGDLVDLVDRPGPRLPVAGAIRDVVHHRLGHLSPRANRVLTIAAVVGEEFAFDVVERLSDVKEEALLDALDEGVRSQVVEEVPGVLGVYSFSHALFRETLEGDLTRARRAFLHLRVAEALEELGGGDADADVGPVAHHLLEGTSVGDAHRAVDYAARAARAAAARFAFEEAVDLLTRALVTHRRFLDHDVARRTELLLALGEAHNRLGHLEEARQAVLAAAAAARRPGGAEQLGLAAVGFGAVVRTGQDLDRRGLGLLEEALARMGPGDSPARALVISRLAKWRFELGRDAEGRSLCEEALEMARRCGDPQLAAAVLSNVHWALYGPDHIGERLALSTRLLAIGEEMGDLGLVAQGHEWRLRHLLELGDAEQAAEAALLLARVAREVGSDRYLWYAAVHRAMQACVEGRFEEAERLAHGALGIGRHLGGRHPTRRRERRADRPAELTFELQLFVLRWLRGRIAEIVPAMEGLVADEPASDGWLCGLALLYSDQDREQEARQIFDAVARRGLARVRRDVEWLPKMASLANVCAYLGDARRAAELYDLLVPYQARNCTILEFAFFGSTSHVLGLLAATMSRWEAAEHHLLAALARHERMKSPPWMALTSHALARVLLERDRPGDLERAAELSSGTLVTARRLGMATLERRVLALQAYGTARRGTDFHLGDATAGAARAGKLVKAITK